MPLKDIAAKRLGHDFVEHRGWTPTTLRYAHLPQSFLHDLVGQVFTTDDHGTRAD